MSLKAMPIWMYHGVQDDYQFNEVVKPENLTRLPPLNEQEVKPTVIINKDFATIHLNLIDFLQHYFRLE